MMPPLVAHLLETAPLLVFGGVSLEVLRRAGVLNLAFTAQVSLAAVLFSFAGVWTVNLFVPIVLALAVGIVVPLAIMSLSRGRDELGIFTSLVLALMLLPLIKLALPPQPGEQIIAAPILLGSITESAIVTTAHISEPLVAVIIGLLMQPLTERTSWGRALEVHAVAPQMLSDGYRKRAKVWALAVSGVLTALIVVLDLAGVKGRFVIGYYQNLTVESLVVALACARSFFLLIPAALAVALLQYAFAELAVMWSLPSYTYLLALGIAIIGGGFLLRTRKAELIDGS
jgi:ABC-type uncharacterized transport system permease subunit